MDIYAIGDLHLSGNPPRKPMTIFGDYWDKHWEKIKRNWLAAVRDEDTVILCGDISWGMDLPEAMEDLRELIALPGRKLLLRGNHDYWWSSLAKNEKATEGKLLFLQNNCYQAGDVAICGSRGWNIPNMEGFLPEDEKIYQRELQRVEMSLKAAQKTGCQKILLALHFPPLYQEEQVTGFTELCRRYGVKVCVFGHIHGVAAHALNVFEGMKNGTEYRLVACDYLDFQPLKLDI